GNTKVVLYVDGTAVASSTSMKIRPTDINPVRNYIGRSQFVSDSRFKGYIDDFRIYNSALSEENIEKIYNGEEPTDINTPVVQEKKYVEGYNIFDISGKRLTSPQKGINIINGKKINY
ncbi:MAG: LamG domain-containing protein, partial [Prevotella sp.]|nr:LamG domain-containing protein [Prevotella sp.]